MNRLLALLAVVAAAVPLAGITRATPAPAPGGVYVAPFAATDADAPDEPSIGRAVRQTVTAVLARRSVPIVAGDPAPADPLAAGRAAGARYVVSGSVQSVAGQLRLTGQVTDLTTDAVVAGLAATGPAADRLDLEDAVCDQATRALTPRALTATPSATPAATPAAAAEPPLAAADFLAKVDPPAPLDGTYFAGSRLERSLNTNRTPPTDYAQQLYNSRTNNALGSYHNYAYPIFGGFGGFGSFGFGGFGGFGFGGLGFAGGYGTSPGGSPAPYGDYVVHAGGLAGR